MLDNAFQWSIVWLATDIPVDLFDFYVDAQVELQPFKGIDVSDRHGLLEELAENPDFEEFWQHAKETYPDKEAYFVSLRDKAMPYEGDWIKKEYYRYMFESDFDNLSEDERQKYKDELNNFRPKVYQMVLREEAIRLNCCVSEVRPESLVLPFTPRGDEESKLADLPAAILVKVMNVLDTVDIFRVSLVCKRWKRLIRDNPRALTKAEHARTTHLLTFTEWMDPTKTLFYEDIGQKYQSFSWGIIQWCFGITNYLETVIVDHPISSHDVLTLLQSCPNLKNLQMDKDDLLGHVTDDALLEVDLPLPCLEFYYSNVRYCKRGRRFDQHFLLSCNSIRYLHVSLGYFRVIKDSTRSQMKHAFRNLIGLDLADYTLQVLEVLADVDDLKLRYLGFGILETFEARHQVIAVTEARLRSLHAKIFPRLKMLEILKANSLPGLSNFTIKLLTDLKVKLKSAKLGEFSSCVLRMERDELDEQDTWTSDALADFAQMLHSNDPELDLSQVYLTVRTEELWQDLQQMNIGFTILKTEDDDYKKSQIAELNSVLTRRHLGLEF